MKTETLHKTSQHKAIILAAGLGTRMRQSGAKGALSEKQTAMAAEGLKALIPIDRPFLDYSLSNVADAGYRRVCLVVGPRQEQLQEYYSGLDCPRLSFEFAVQEKQLGTADALAAAADFAGDDPVLVLNCDNYYPTTALQHLLEADSTSLVGYDRGAMVEKTNIKAERLAAFSVIEHDHQRHLTNIIEKPMAEEVARLSEPVLISMNCWRFGPAIFEACRAIGPSSRGEYEIPDAVMYSIRHLGERYRVIPCNEGVLDLSSRDDIEDVSRRLRDVKVQL